MSLPRLKNGKQVYIDFVSGKTPCPVVEKDDLHNKTDVMLPVMLDQITDLHQKYHDDKAIFDFYCGLTLHESLASMSIQREEIISIDFWEWLSLVALRDVVEWRYPKKTKNRFLFDRNHVFWRLWMRVDVCYTESVQDPYEVFKKSSPEKESDDFWAQLLQRSFSGYKIITKVLVELILGETERDKFRIEELCTSRQFYRGLFMKLMLRQPVYCFAAMDNNIAIDFVKREAEQLEESDLPKA